LNILSKIVLQRHIRKIHNGNGSHYYLKLATLRLII
jgi:hypothetical protein